jgi:hypothetical protein
MTAYIKVSTLEYPRHEGDIRLEYPEIAENQTGDTFPCPDTYMLVRSVQVPECNYEFQTVEELPPTQTDGAWTQQFLLRDLTAEELQARADALAEIERLKQEQI